MFELKVFDTVQDLRKELGEPYKHNAEVLHTVVECEHVMTNPEAQELMDCITIDPHQSSRKVCLMLLSEIVLATHEDFRSGKVTFAALYSAAREAGHTLCSADTGPRLRLAYIDQPRYQYVLVLSEPIMMHGKPLIFGLNNDDHELFLGVVPADLEQSIDQDVLVAVSAE